jgi:hypothetical protein
MASLADFGLPIEDFPPQAAGNSLDIAGSRTGLGRHAQGGGKRAILEHGAGKIQIYCTIPYFE